MFHFKWIPVLKGQRFEQLPYSQKQMINHFEFQHEITTKDLLFRNLLSYAELNKINIFDHVPLTFILNVDSPTYCSDFSKFAKCYEVIQDASKDITDFKQALGIINSKLQQIRLSRERLAVTHCKPKIVETHFAGKNIWMLKPTGFNRGRGVTVFNSMEKLKGLIKYYSEENSDSSIFNNISKGDTNEEVQSIIMSVKSRTFVIQKYIEKPLLINERKFDIRAWVLVTHEMKVHFFKEGYVRTSSAAYSINTKDIDKVDIHLTNNAVQKYCQQYGAFEDGNQLSFNDFQVTLLLINRTI
jgi:hypothetical protein